MPTPILLDLRDLGINTKGVGRVLQGLTPRLLALDPERYEVACTRAALAHLPDSSAGRVHLVPRLPQSVWEQVGLPALATRIGAAAVYSHRECGALWGPPLLLHVTEDPEVRWRRDPPTDLRGRSRRAYSRLLMRRSLARAGVGASTATVADDLARSYGVARTSIDIIPLAVDHDLFRPVTAGLGAPFFLHLASGDPRDRTGLLIGAFARFARDEAGPPRLVVVGEVGAAAAEIDRLAREAGVSHLVERTGRLSDDELVAHYSGALAVVQPSSDEGFGLQPLEAMACGALLVVAREPAVAEVVGDAVAVWSEPSEAPLAEALGTAWSDAHRRAAARVANPSRARAFTWDRTAEIVHRALLELSGEAARR